MTLQTLYLGPCGGADRGFPSPGSGFLRGEQDAQPQLIAFHPCFQQGALLTVVSGGPRCQRLLHLCE